LRSDPEKFERTQLFWYYREVEINIAHKFQGELYVITITAKQKKKEVPDWFYRSPQRMKYAMAEMIGVTGVCNI
jgi:hypothetical protein